jgi:rubredoxin
VAPGGGGGGHHPTWFLLDAGVGAFSPATVDGRGAPAEWALRCGATRASFMSNNASAAGAVDLLWTAPRVAGPVALRVAAATAMGELTVNIAVLNASCPPLPAGFCPPLPAGSTVGYVCTTLGPSNTSSAVAAVTTKQCQPVPPNTFGAQSLPDCEAQCWKPLPSPQPPSYGCERCAHIYDPVRDGGGKAFEDLPDTWACPVCGALKSAYFQVEGTGQWVHEDK